MGEVNGIGDRPALSDFLFICTEGDPDRTEPIIHDRGVDGGGAEVEVFKDAVVTAVDHIGDGYREPFVVLFQYIVDGINHQTGGHTGTVDHGRSLLDNIRPGGIGEGIFKRHHAAGRGGMGELNGIGDSLTFSDVILIGTEAHVHGISRAALIRHRCHLRADPVLIGASDHGFDTDVLCALVEHIIVRLQQDMDLVFIGGQGDTGEPGGWVKVDVSKFLSGAAGHYMHHTGEVVPHRRTVVWSAKAQQDSVVRCAAVVDFNGPPRPLAVIHARIFMPVLIVADPHDPSGGPADINGDR
ncbi:hypothetical protein, partial [Veronia pacifica]|uniref:hypothetical protein n=1 Tax=Veronia pacifica TaxID=1080227 RepID=UPI0036449D88